MTTQMLRAVGVERSIFGRKGRFCNDHCADSMRCDREHGVIHGPYRIQNEDGSVHWCKDAEEMSMLAACCAYCENQLSITKLPSKAMKRTAKLCGIDVHGMIPNLHAEAAAAVKAKNHTLYDAVASCGQHVDNLSRDMQMAIVYAWLARV